MLRRHVVAVVILSIDTTTITSNEIGATTLGKTAPSLMPLRHLAKQNSMTTLSRMIFKITNKA
jgi:hypothetical protein